MYHSSDFPYRVKDTLRRDKFTVAINWLFQNVNNHDYTLSGNEFIFRHEHDATTFKLKFT